MMWGDAKKALDAFQRAVQQVRSVRLGTPQATEVFDRYTFAPNTLMLTTQPGFMGWFTLAFDKEAEVVLDAMRPRGPLLMALSDDHKPEDYRELLSQLDQFEKTLQKFLNQVGPAQFRYKGFQVTDTLRLGPTKLQLLFDSINFLQAIFKKRGVPELIQKGVKGIVLRETGDAGGYYDSRTQIISLGPTLFTDQMHRTLNTGTWLMGSFMHEFGHFVHMAYIKGEARQFWDGAWDPIHEVRRTLDQVSSSELEKFFGLLQRDRFNPAKTAKRLKGADKIKFAYWLRNLDGEPLITPNQFRLTKRGKHIFETLQNPELYVRVHYGYDPSTPEFEQRVQRVIERMRKMLRLNSGVRIAPEMVTSLKEENPEIDEALNNLYVELGIPTEYGKKDELEDFADTFVLFMVSPEKLSPNALYRMRRTLWLSGFGGKPVSKLAHYVVHRYLRQGNAR